MTKTGWVILSAFLAASTCLFLQAEEQLRTLTGSCSITATAKEAEADLRLERGGCEAMANVPRKPRSHSARSPASPWRICSAKVRMWTRVIRAEAGTITCSGAVHDGRMSGAFTFVPDPAFVAPHAADGISRSGSEKLQAYTLFRIAIAWVRSLQAAGVSGLDSGNLIALRIFHVDPDYVRSLNALGYPTPDAEKLVALRVQHVDPEEVKQIRALGYQPTLDELIQMRIFKITPDFIHRMQAEGLKT